MRLMRLWILLLIAPAVVACGAPRIDASSDDTMKTSIRRVRTSLSQEQRAKFDDALVAIGAASIERGGPATPLAMREHLKALHGKTADEVIAEGSRIAK